MEYVSSVKTENRKKGRGFGKWIIDHRFPLLAFFVPFLILLIGFVALRLFPFGDNTILTIDMYHQYAPFFSLLREKLITGGSLFYSWDSGVGTNFWGLIGYYLACPLNALVVFFPRNMLTEAMAFITLLKTGAMGLTFYWFVRGVFKKDGLPNVIFGCMYALCNYMVAYTWNIMWMDALAMLPLSMLGLEQMLNGKKPWLYCFSLGFAIISNFYIAFMVAVYAVIYFFAHLFVHKDSIVKSLFWKKVLRFTVFSLIAGGISAFMSIPTYIALKGIASTGYAAPGWDSFKFDFTEILASHLSFIEPSVMSGMPNVSCGLLALMMIPVYWTGKSSTREKIAATGILAILFLFFNSSLLNYVMHGLRYPNSLDHRFAFLYCFTLIVMAWRGFTELEERSSKIYGWLFAGMTVLIFFCQHEYGSTVTHIIAYANGLVVIGYLVILGLYRKGILPKVVSYTLILFIVGTELVVQWPIYRGVAGRNTEYIEHNNVSDIMNKVESYDDDWYRLEKLDPVWTSNDCAWFGYKGVTQFNSMAYSGMAKMMRQLGFSNNGLNSFFEDSSIPTVNSMLGVRYLVTDKKIETGSAFESVEEIGKYTVYRNPYALSLGFVTGSGITEWDILDNNAFKVQNSFFKLACGIEPLELLTVNCYTSSGMEIRNNSCPMDWLDGYYFDRKNNTTSTTNCSIVNTAEQPVYLYIKTKYSQEVGKVNVTTPDGDTKEYSYGENHIIALGTCEEGNIDVKMTFDSNNTGYFMVSACTVNEAAMEEAYTRLSSGNWDIERFSDTRVSGTVHSDKDGILFMTVPYDKGWTVTVDGERSELLQIGEGLSGVAVSEGEHTVTISFVPSGFVIGLIISCLSLAALAALALLKSKRKPVNAPVQARHLQSVSVKEERLVECSQAQKPGTEVSEPEEQNQTEENGNECTEETDQHTDSCV